MKGWYFLMKKILILVFLSILIISLINNEKMIVIPDESIRFRVISASNRQEDINAKNYLVDNVSKNISNLFNSNTIEESRKNINESIKDLEEVIDDTFKEINYEKPYKVNYGINYFPEKIYKGIKYNSGYYESLVITIDKGEGSNYWCVMFPPLCMIDEDTPKEEYEYKLLVSEIINKFKSIKDKK